MAPFIVFVVLFASLAGLGLLGVDALSGWYTPLRFALAGLFLLTASAHWGKRRPDLVRMVPPAFAKPDSLVTLTGILELLGVVGLLVPATAPWAALGLTLLLLAMFPANMHAAREHLSIDGRRVPALVPRTLIQGVFVAATVAVFVTGSR